MHAMDFYVTTCRCVMQADPAVPESWADLYRLLPCLRQSLSCYVCFKLVLDPMGPDHNVCKHAVCEKCVGGKMKLKPSCSWCKDYWDFVPNSMLKVLVSCFKKLCVYIYSCPIGRSICNSSINGETNNLVTILKEVIDFEDHYLPTRSTVQRTQIAAEEESEPKTNDAQMTCGDSMTESHVRPSCSSDSNEDVQQLSTCTTQEEHIEDLDGLDKNNEVSLPLRRHFRRSSRSSNGESKETKEVVHEKHSLKQKPQKENSIKRTVFMKKTSQKRRKLFLRKTGVRQHKKKQPVTVSKFYPVRKRKTLDAPQNLEKMDISVSSTKNSKKELQPPELKPPSFCKCGKSGNYNQLTCLGQRCPCYNMKLPCIGCKCRGCRNPKKGPSVQTNSARCMSDLWSSCSRTSAALS